MTAFLKTDDAKNQLEDGGHGTSQSGIYLSDLKEILIPVVNYEIQKEFGDFMDTIYELVKVIEVQIKNLTELKEKRIIEHFTVQDI